MVTPAVGFLRGIMFARYLTFVFLLTLSAFFFTAARAASDSGQGRFLATSTIEGVSSARDQSI